MGARVSWEILILIKKTLDVCPNSLVVPNPLVVNSLCLRKSINPVLFPPESPDYGKHTAGIPILCQSSHQIFLLYKGIHGGGLKAKQPHHWLFDCRELTGKRFSWRTGQLHKAARTVHTASFQNVNCNRRDNVCKFLWPRLFLPRTKGKINKKNFF